MHQRILPIAILLAASSVGASDPNVERERLDFFESKIRPVLVKQCYECHAVDSKKLSGGLLVDSRQSLLQGGESGPAIVPNAPQESLLISALKHDDFEMPPKGKLSQQVIADFEKWIEDGATDPRDTTKQVIRSESIDISAGRKHWAYQPLQTPAIPKVSDAAWPANDIDRFILARLESAGLLPGSDAREITLVRRLHFDLIGLPPTPEQIARFVDDKSPEAYENLVDQLMESPRFGERWGRHWLDVSRFAESMSLRGALLKHAWRYRDYVIESFNNDKPFDQFITQQLAGDLLDAPSIEAQRQNLIATTFLVMGDALLENQDKSQLDMDVVDEQLEAIGKGLLAQTITCARCHDHKFDPIPTSDYYALAGILKNVQGLTHANVSKSIEIPLPISDEAKRELEIHNSTVAKLQSEIETLKLKEAGNDLLPLQVKDLPGFVVDNPDAKVIGKWNKSNGILNRVGSEYLVSKTLGSKVIYPVTFPGAGKYEVRITIAQHANRAPQAHVIVHHTNGQTSFLIDQRQKPGNFNEAKSDGYFQSLGSYAFPSGQSDAVEISVQDSGGLVVADAVQFLPVDNDSKVTIPPISQSVKALSPAERQALKKQITELTTELSALKKRAPASELVNSVVENSEPADLKIHIRGSIDNLGAIAPRGILQVANYGPAPKMPANASGRLELAHWIVDPANPLTARVMVNRVWHWLIGAGLIRTVDNFGTTGESPSHPELLDHLAVQFVQQGWSVKKLIRTIVLSRTYRLSSMRGEQQEDPENRLLAHMNRRRLDAESLRDTMLSVGGTLKLEMGGATFPASLKTDVGFQSQTPRRSVYVPVFRSSLPELFELFDFANPSMVTGRRHVSTVAPQALFMMNHAFVRSQAQLTAESILNESQPEKANRIDHAYLLILGRHATAKEIAICHQFLSSVNDTTEDGQVAAWTQMVQSLFSTIEFRYIR
ncbi:MAG: DUF1553 domain-containing protein [Planctomycetaceae bacterium]|nr:DUF1553 domain-containing protein [Planctomycetaceae bacterium]